MKVFSTFCRLQIPKELKKSLVVDTLSQNYKILEKLNIT